eukprot:gene7830-665_t
MLVSSETATEQSTKKSSRPCMDPTSCYMTPERIYPAETSGSDEDSRMPSTTKLAAAQTSHENLQLDFITSCDTEQQESNANQLLQQHTRQSPQQHLTSFQHDITKAGENSDISQKTSSLLAIPVPRSLPSTPINVVPQGILKPTSKAANVSNDATMAHSISNASENLINSGIVLSSTSSFQPTSASCNFTPSRTNHNLQNPPYTQSTSNIQEPSATIESYSSPMRISQFDSKNLNDLSDKHDTYSTHTHIEPIESRASSAPLHFAHKEYQETLDHTVSNQTPSKTTRAISQPTTPSQAEYRTPVRSNGVTTPTSSGRGSKRGPYRCGRCGQMLKGHSCPYKTYSSRSPRPPTHNRHASQSEHDSHIKHDVSLSSVARSLAMPAISSKELSEIASAPSSLSPAMKTSNFIRNLPSFFVGNTSSNNIESTASNHSNTTLASSVFTNGADSINCSPVQGAELGRTSTRNDDDRLNPNILSSHSSITSHAIQSSNMPSTIELEQKSNQIAALQLISMRTHQLPLTLPDGTAGDPLGRTVFRLQSQFGIHKEVFLQIFAEEMKRYSPRASPALSEIKETLTPFSAHVCDNLFSRDGFVVQLADGRKIYPAAMDFKDEKIFFYEQADIDESTDIGDVQPDTNEPLQKRAKCNIQDLELSSNRPYQNSSSSFSASFLNDAKISTGKLHADSNAKSISNTTPSSALQISFCQQSTMNGTQKISFEEDGNSQIHQSASSNKFRVPSCREEVGPSLKKIKQESAEYKD